jgi:hypothetical protein
MLAGAVALWLTQAGAAHATVGSTEVWGTPAHGRQTLTVTLYDDIGGSAATLYLTYRRVDNDAPPDEPCVATMATNPDTRLVDGLAAGPAPYSVTRSVSLPLGLYGVCYYIAAGGSTVPADAALVSSGIGGHYTAPRTPRPTRIGLTLRQAGTTGTFSGPLWGTNTGKVLIQRRSHGHWRTVKSCRAIHTRFSTRATVRRGSIYRARLVGTTVYAASTSNTLRAR